MFPGVASALLRQRYMKSNSIGTQLKQSQTAINNALKLPEIKAAMLPYGYTVAKLNAGKALYTAVGDAVDESASADGAQSEAAQAVKAAFKEARTAFQGLAKLARVVFAKQPGPLTALGLNKPMPRRMDDFAVAAVVLFNYESFTQAMKDALVAKSYGSSQISQARGKLAELIGAREAHADLGGEAEQATADQNEALKKLHDWYMEFRKLARIALKDKPRFLNRLGIPYRVTKSKAQRAAPAKSKATRAAKKLPKAA